jgi:hypothetical protein
MTEKNEVMTTLLKELVDRLIALEQTVYNQDNLLMKAGLVKVDTPRPTMSVRDNLGSDTTDNLGSDTIAKMSWDELNTMVKKMEGQ